MNTVHLSGNITRDIEVRHTQSGKAFAHVSIAVNRPFSKDKDAVDFIPLVAWEKTAEFMGKYLSKGSRILVEGRLQTSKYKDKDGNDRTGFDVLVDRIEFAGGKKDGNSDSRKDAKDYGFGGEPVEPDDTPF